jgi:hypothetical protein
MRDAGAGEWRMVVVGAKGLGERRRYGSSPDRVHAPALHGASGGLQACSLHLVEALPWLASGFG